MGSTSPLIGTRSEGLIHSVDFFRRKHGNEVSPGALRRWIAELLVPNYQPGSRILGTHGGVHRISLSALRVAGRHPVYEDRAGRGSSLPGLPSAGPKGPGSPCYELDGLLHVLCGNFPPAAVGTYHARAGGGGARLLAYPPGRAFPGGDGRRGRRSPSLRLRILFRRISNRRFDGPGSEWHRRG